MRLQDAIEILREENNFLKGIPVTSLLWKKALLDFFNSDKLTDRVKKALIIVAANTDFEEVIREYFAFFNREKDSEIRRFMMEALANNFNEMVIDLQFPLLGVKEHIFDRYVRQLVSQNIILGIKEYQKKRPLKAALWINKLKNIFLKDENTFMRMNAAIILRNIADKKVLPELEKRLEIEKQQLIINPNDVGIPYVIRELERTISALKERA